MKLTHVLYRLLFYFLNFQEKIFCEIKVTLDDFFTGIWSRSLINP